VAARPVPVRLTKRRGVVGRPVGWSRSADGIAHLASPWGYSATGSVPATRGEAVGFPAFERCLDLIAGSLANLELQAGKVDPSTGVWQRLDDQPAYLVDPDWENDVWQWRYSTVRDLAEFGNHIELLGDVDYRTGRPGSGLPLPPEHLAVMWHSDGSWNYMYGTTPLARSDVLHIKRGGLSGEVLSTSPVQQFGVALRGALTAEEWSGRYLGSGGLPPAIIQVPGTVDQPAATKFKADWRTMVATGEALLLPSNVSVVPLVSDASKQQLVEARQWNAHMACTITGVPPYKLGLEGPSMTYQNVETADIGFRVDTLDRYGQPIAHAISKHLLPAGWKARWQWAQVERADVRTQIEVTATAVGAGLLSVDEGRQRLQYPPLESSMTVGTTPVGVPDLGAQEV
jgi:HK97 family phage portal protein